MEEPSCIITPNPAPLGQRVEFTLTPPPAELPSIDGLSWLSQDGAAPSAVVLQNGPFDLSPLSCPPLQVLAPFDLTGELPAPQPDLGPAPVTGFSPYNLLALIPVLAALCWWLITHRRHKSAKRQQFDIFVDLQNFVLDPSQPPAPQFAVFFGKYRRYLGHCLGITKEQPSVGDVQPYCKNEHIIDLLKKAEYLEYSQHNKNIEEYEIVINEIRASIKQDPPLF